MPHISKRQRLIKKVEELISKRVALRIEEDDDSKSSSDSEREDYSSDEANLKKEYDLF
jgi:hypothetical protein